MLLLLLVVVVVVGGGDDDDDCTLIPEAPWTMRLVALLAMFSVATSTQVSTSSFSSCSSLCDEEGWGPEGNGPAG